MYCCFKLFFAWFESCALRQLKLFKIDQKQNRWLERLANLCTTYPEEFGLTEVSSHDMFYESPQIYTYFTLKRIRNLFIYTITNLQKNMDEHAKNKFQVYFLSIREV
jgi:hypothetical protein